MVLFDQNSTIIRLKGQFLDVAALENAAGSDLESHLKSLKHLIVNNRTTFFTFQGDNMQG